jgi:hypothetical protein
VGAAVKWSGLWQMNIAAAGDPIHIARLHRVRIARLFGRERIRSVSGYFRLFPVLAKNQDILTSVKGFSHRWGPDTLMKSGDPNDETGNPNE